MPNMNKPTLPMVAPDASSVEPMLLENLRERFPDFWKNRLMRLYDLRISPVLPGTLRRGRKLRRLIDQRVPGL